MEFRDDDIFSERDELEELAAENRIRYNAVQPLAVGKRVLDTESGFGVGTAWLAQYALEAYGIDALETAVEQAEARFASRPNLTFSHASREALPFPDHSFDLVISLIHTEDADDLTQRAFWAEVARVLAPTGLFVKATSEAFATVAMYGQQAVIDLSLRKLDEEQNPSPQTRALTNARAQLRALQRERAKLAQEHHDLATQFSAIAAELEMHQRSVPGRAYVKYRRVRDNALPVDSKQREFFKRGYKGLVSRARSLIQRQKETPELITAPVEPPPDIVPFDFSQTDAPIVSIIIPVYNHWETTYVCLKSLYETLGDLPAEIILADDGSKDDTRRAGEIVGGMTIVADGKNRGFLENCNNAATKARGRYIFLLNNDTKVKSNAVQALVDLLDSDPTTGLVGSKLIYPDGRLQEAGGIVWRDGTAWNFGRFQDPEAPEFNYVRDVDYMSGASIMIRADLWREIGGFDRRYVPAYYEDTDLAFEVRKRGFRVRYQPLSVVVHYEGISNGTSTGTGIKAYQVRNRAIMRDKWSTVLDGEHPPHGWDVFTARDRSLGKPSILVVDHYVPHIDKDAGSRSVWGLLRALLKMGFQVKFIGDNYFRHEPYTTLLQQAGIEVLYGPKYAAGWAKWLAANGRHIDFVLLNRPHIGPKYLAAIRKYTKALVLYYGHDLEHVREAKRAEIEDNDELRARVATMRVAEQQTMDRMDVVLSCSSSEATVIRGMLPKKHVEWIPLYAVDVDRSAAYTVREREGLLFVGGFAHKPNVDAALHFVREQWPAILREIPNIELTIAGSNPPPEVLALADDSIQVLGFVPDTELLELYRRARIVVVPLRYGAGVKGKTVEAMAHGVPVVGTAIAFEGMDKIEAALNPLQLTDAIEESVIALYNDGAALKIISEREREYVESRFSLDGIANALHRAMAKRGKAKSA